MRAMVLTAIQSLEDNPAPLKLVELPRPVPGSDEVLIRVSACGVCHTELDEIEGRTPPPQLPVVPGHEVVGRIEEVGSAVTTLRRGDRVGVGWIHSSDGSGTENLSAAFRATGRDVNGGYAEFMAVGADYAYPIPEIYSDAEAAPLLCAGGVGYRALKLTGLENGEPLGLTGFGGSGHLVLSLAQHLYPDSRIFVFARSASERQFALELGANWAGDTAEVPPAPPAAIIDTTPAWRPVLAALSVLAPGGRLVINAIRKEAADRSLMAEIDYERQLWMEKELKTVANVTAADIRAFLSLAAEISLKPEVQTCALEAANEALQRLKRGHLRGAFVLIIDSKNN
jgi:propanol-preferring alcohol dehydrogenase